ncbi:MULTISPECIES: cation:proton antiporter [Streptomyces]|uniref:cation:proton antiporter domain-containing protein n=1 Tax=Streptomyces lycopersici TaxID=2974589 RepID=UPI0021CF2478|nr:cation:proton antiporter [Streptomyces sp. NEAU-383]
MLFRLAISVAIASGAVSWQHATGEFALLAGGGCALGAAVAGIVVLIRRRTSDPVLETVIALVTPYAAYVLAESLHTSGDTTVVVTGVVLGSTGHRPTDAHIRLLLHAVYGTVGRLPAGERRLQPDRTTDAGADPRSERQRPEWPLQTW